MAYGYAHQVRHGQPVHGWVREDLDRHCPTRESLMRSVLAMCMRRKAIPPDTDPVIWERAICDVWSAAQHCMVEPS
jgi:hypothetical protein